MASPLQAEILAFTDLDGEPPLVWRPGMREAVHQALSGFDEGNPELRQRIVELVELGAALAKLRGGEALSAGLLDALEEAPGVCAVAAEHRLDLAHRRAQTKEAYAEALGEDTRAPAPDPDRPVLKLSSLLAGKTRG
jgi:hypothetical protein